MRKDYYAAHVSQNLPRLDKDAAANGSNVVHLSGSMERRGFDIQPCAAYFTLRIDTKAGHGEAKADTARRKGRGSGARRRAQPTPRSRPRPLVQRQPVLRPQGSRSGPLRDGAPPSGRQSAHQRCRRRLRGFAAHVLQSPECVSRPWPRRSGATAARTQGRPQDLRRGSRLRRRVEGGHAGSHHAAICRRNRQPLWRPRAPTKPGAGAGAQKKRIDSL